MWNAQVLVLKKFIKTVKMFISYLSTSDRKSSDLNL